MNKQVNMLSEANLKKWVEQKSIMSLGMKKLKELISKELPPLDALKVESMKQLPIQQILRDDGTNSGMLTFQVLPFIQFQFFTDLYNFNTKGEAANMIELGASNGRVAWKALLTGTKVVANDLYSNQIKEAHAFIKTNIPHKHDNFSSIVGDLFDILKNAPEHKNHFDFVYSQNVIHFFNPSQCETFAHVVWDLLKPGGKAYITAQTFATITSLAQSEQGDIPQQYMEKYREHKMILSHIVKNMEEHKPFPAFIKLVHDKNNKLKSVTTPVNIEPVFGNLKISHYLTEDTFTTLFSKIGFDINLIACGDRVGQEHPCYSQAEEGDKLTSVYISVVLEKPIINGEDLIPEIVHYEL